MTGLQGLRHRVRPAAGEPAGALVLMHGRGTGEDDMFPLLDVFDPQRRLVGVAPGGPLALAPAGKHWYAVRRIGYPDPATFATTFAALAEWVDAIPQELGVPPERTILGGFSQGAVMSYALGLAAGRPTPAGILALSGFIPTVDGLVLEIEGREGLPVAIAHGTNDQVIGVEWGRTARDALRAAGADVTYLESPVAHTLDPRELPTLADWVRRTLTPAATT
ncbi:MAG: alpha/beta hydrolase [Solirubrobacteraceae bacterium]